MSMHVQHFVGTTVQASTVSLELEALSGIVRVLNGWGPLGAVRQSLAEDLLGAEALPFHWFSASWESDRRVSFFSWEACRIPFTLRVRLLKLLEQLLLTVLILLDQD